MEREKLKKLYGRLKSIDALASSQREVTVELKNDYNKLVQELSEILKEDLKSFFSHAVPDSPFGINIIQAPHLREKTIQLVSHLEYGYNLSEHVIEIGSIYNSLTDKELKDRCSDLLSASSNFDRVINQATQVLEDRIRNKSGLNTLNGVDLVNKAINSVYDKTVLQLSDDPDEHEGFAHICRGIVLSFRNPTHHKIVAGITREDALKICAFIDKLLQIVDGSKKVK